jgi:hypothetical protein
MLRKAFDAKFCKESTLYEGHVFLEHLRSEEKLG